MTQQVKEKRKFRRILFSTTENVNAICTLSGNESESIMKVANISAGGVGLIAGKEVAGSLKVNDLIVLNRIDGHHELDFMAEIQLEVKWVLDSEIMDNIGFGCEYTDAQKQVHDRLLRFVEDRINHNKY